MTDEQLHAIKIRIENAIEGPWEVVKSQEKGVQIGTTWAHPQLKSAVAIVTTGKTLNGVITHIMENDAEFIAHARQDVPTLVEEVERLRTELEMEKKASKWITREGALLRENLEDKNDALREENEKLRAEKNELLGIAAVYKFRGERAEMALKEIANACALIDKTENVRIKIRDIAFKALSRDEE